MKTKWTEQDYESLGWHDCHVHSMGIKEGMQGTGDLWFDLDYIMEWLCPTESNGTLRFKIAPARLTFREVFGLRIALDYATLPAAMGPFSIGSIERSARSMTNGIAAIDWKIEINWPSGAIEFESPGFVQELAGEIVLSDSQYLRNRRE